MTNDDLKALCERLVTECAKYGYQHASIRPDDPIMVAPVAYKIIADEMLTRQEEIFMEHRLKMAAEFKRLLEMAQANAETAATKIIEMPGEEFSRAIRKEFAAMGEILAGGRESITRAIATAQAPDNDALKQAVARAEKAGTLAYYAAITAMIMSAAFFVMMMART